jgi:diacylglycerol kinase (ATP)
LVPVTLVHNPSAGLRPTLAHDLRRHLARHGFASRYLSTATKPHLDRALFGANAVVAAGGDGTVAKVLRAMRRAPLEIGIVPTGVANNIASAFGIPTDPAAAIAALRDGAVQRFDLGRVQMPGLKHTLVESLGIGVLAATAAATPHHDSETAGREGKLFEARARLTDALSVAGPIPRLIVDGLDLSGRALFVEILNIPLSGPNLALAPAASPCDGVFDLVYAEARHRGDLIDWLRDGAPPQSVPALPTLRGKRFRLEWAGAAVRIDDDFPGIAEGRLTLRVCAGQALVIAPSPTARRRPS